MKKLQIFGLGFDAFGQITGACKSKGNTTEDILQKPNLIGEAKSTLEVIWAGWADSLISIDSEVELRGFSASDSGGTLKLFLEDQDHNTTASIKCGFGWEELIGIVDSLGNAWFFSIEKQQLLLCKALNRRYKGTISNIIVCGNDQMAVIHDQCRQVDTFRNTLPILAVEDIQDISVLSRSDFLYPLVDCCGAESHFTALDSIGQVWTWGSNLHHQLLREESPRSPGFVDVLEGCPMAQIASQGFLTACLSKEMKDIYIWGWPFEDNPIEALPDTPELAGLVQEFGEDEHGISIAAGNAFILVHTNKNRVVAVGKSESGAIGETSQTSRFKQLLKFDESFCTIDRIRSGPSSTFITVTHTNNYAE
ncbi:hypothetical protein V1511DRAFT_494251 [Dipodascopsis uninucleata]